MNNSIKCKCKICGNIWETTALHLVDKKKPSGCKKCLVNKSRKSQDEFLKEFKLKNSNYKNIVVLGEYKSTNTKIECLCNICNHTWYPTPKTLLNNHGCSKCGGTGGKKHEEFLVEMQLANPKIEILSIYKNDSTKVECKCLLCNHIWGARPNHLLRDRGCPNCTKSKGEIKIKDYLISNNISFAEQYRISECRNVYTLPFDFAIFTDDKLLCLIEYQGSMHYQLTGFSNAEEILNYRQYCDGIKRDFCMTNNIFLLEISFWDFNNIDSILQNNLAI